MFVRGWLCCDLTFQSAMSWACVLLSVLLSTSCRASGDVRVLASVLLNAMACFGGQLRAREHVSARRPPSSQVRTQNADRVASSDPFPSASNFPAKLHKLIAPLLSSRTVLATNDGWSAMPAYRQCTLRWAAGMRPRARRLYEKSRGETVGRQKCGCASVALQAG